MTFDRDAELTAVMEDSPPVRVDKIGRARLGDQEHGLVHFFITNDHVLVYADERNVPTLVGFSRIVGFSPASEAERARGEPYVVRTAEGEEWTLTPTGQCGCGRSIGTAFYPFSVRKAGR